MRQRPTKAWLSASAGVKDREMLRSTPMPFALRCALLLGVIACEKAAPAVQGEPAPVRPSAVVQPAAAGAQRALSPETLSPEAAAQPGEAERSLDSPKLDRTKYAAQPQGASAAGSPAASTDKPSTDKPSPDKPEPALGGVVSEEAFSAWLQAPAPASASAPAHVEAILMAKAPYHCNEEYPHKFKLDAPPPGVSYPEETVRGMQVTPERGVLRIPLQASVAGPVKVSGTLSFSVCTEERCLVEKRPLALNLLVK